MSRQTDLEDAGYVVFPYDEGVAQWARAAEAAAHDVLADPDMQSKWWRHDKTWFVGVDALPTDATGAIGGVALQGPWSDLVRPTVAWHKAQLSVVRPGYPGRDPTESDAAHAFRRHRDAAHLDGLLPLGPQKRRHLIEPHAFILGLPLNAVAPGASPLVVWEGSHRMIREAFEEVFRGLEPRDWASVDVTEAYKAVRARVFEACPRRALPVLPGQAMLVHRLAIHGVAPWGNGAWSSGGQRMVAYFRPLLDDIGGWLG